MKKNVHPRSDWNWLEWGNTIVMQHTNLGTEFVILFFLLSGFSIAHSLDANNNTTAFYFRRLIRLYPPYLLGIIWSVVIFLLIKSFAPEVFYNSLQGQEPVGNWYERFSSLRSVVLTLLYVPTDNKLLPQYWSLPFEVVFYLIIPFFIKRFRLMGLIAVTCFIAGCLFHGVYLLDEENTPGFYQYLVDFQIYFFIGCLFYRYRTQLITHFKAGKTLTFLILMCIFEVLVVTKSYFFNQQLNKVDSMLMVVFGYFLIFGGLKHQVRSRGLEKLGAYSYTLYISHYASIFIVKIILYRLGYGFHLIDQMYVWYFGIVVSVIVAYFLYFIAEYPSIKIVRLLRKKEASVTV